MYFLLSGEGPSDIGISRNGADQCEGAVLAHGPMAMFADRIVDARHSYSLLDAGCYGFVSERGLSAGAAQLKDAKKTIDLPGKKTRKETRYFFNNVRLLARIAKEKQDEKDDEVVAILFRDSDGTASSGRGEWADKRQSMLNGFEHEQFPRGVPMIPKPKSEAWLLCALKANPYHNCVDLEDRSGNDNSPNSLKGELNERLGEGGPLVETLCGMIANGTIDVDQINMPSFLAFRSRLEEVM
jgi:hypothetical protein